METHFELYVKQNNRWILEANVQAVKVVREQRNPKTGLTREVTVYSTDRSKARRDDDDEFGSTDPYSEGGMEPPRFRTPYDDDEGEDAGPNVAASTTASRAYGNFADMEVEIGGGSKDWAEMDIPSMDQIETHAKRTRRVAPARPVVAQPTAMGPATIALVKLFIILALSIAIAAAVTFMLQRMGFGSFR